MSRFRALLFLITTVLFAALTYAEEPKDSPAAEGDANAASDPVSISDTRIVWLDDLAKAHARALELQRPLLIDFEAGGCGWCKKLDRETYADGDVIRFVNEHCVPVKLAVDKSVKHKEFSTAFAVTGLPTMLFLRARPHGDECKHDHEDHDEHGEGRDNAKGHDHSRHACHELAPSYIELGRIEGFRVASVFLEEARKFVESGASLSKLEAEAQKHRTEAAAQRAYARALLSAGRVEDASKHLQRALDEVTSDAAGIRLDLGDILRQTGKYEEAIELFRQVIGARESEGGSEVARRAACVPLARCLVSLGKHGEAEKSLGVLLGGVADRLARAQQEDADKKLTDAAPSSFLDKTDLEGLFLRAYLRAHLNRPKDAVADMRIVEAADPNGPWGLRAGFILQRLVD